LCWLLRLLCWLLLGAGCLFRGSCIVTGCSVGLAETCVAGLLSEGRCGTWRQFFTWGWQWPKQWRLVRSDLRCWSSVPVAQSPKNTAIKKAQATKIAIKQRRLLIHTSLGTCSAGCWRLSPLVFLAFAILHTASPPAYAHWYSCSIVRMNSK
jgi:hypothetical protein